MKLILTTALCVLMLSAPALADTASPAPPASNAPTSKAGKTDFTKPFVYDGLRQQLPPSPVDHPQVELRAGPQDKPQP